MARFRVGDVVRIKPNIIAQEVYRMDSGRGPYLVVEQMLKYANGETAVISVDVDESFYKLDIDHGTWKWTDGMLLDTPVVDIQSATDEEFNTFLGEFYVAN